MAINYPEQLKCPACKAEIEINVDGKIVESRDLLFLQLLVPKSYNANDFRENNQKLGTIAVNIIVCLHCSAIIGGK